MAEQLPLTGAETTADEPTLLKSFSAKAAIYHGRVPYLRNLPFNAVAIIAFLILINILAWIAVGIVLVSLQYQCRETHDR